MADEQLPGAPEPQGAASAREPKIIKRYTNRKLYDTVESRYVTLDEIAEMIKAGAEVKIVDNRTKEDLTERDARADHLRGGEEDLEDEPRDAARPHPARRRGAAQRDRRGDAGRAARARGGGEARRRAARADAPARRGQQTSDRAKELVATSQEAVAQLQSEMDERVPRRDGGHVEPLRGAARSSTELSRRIAELERGSTTLEKK